MTKKSDIENEDSSHHYTAYTPTPYFPGDRQFYNPLKSMLKFQILFGQNLFNNSLCYVFTAKFIFLTLLAYMTFVFVIAVFMRGDSIEKWIQLSLYLTPLLAFPCGARIFNSDVYYRLMIRNITDSFMVRFFVTSNDNFDGKPSAHNREWLRNIAIKSMIFPLLLEFIQWGGFMGFVVHENGDTSHFVGNSTSKHISNTVWTGMYYTYWSLSFYLVGFVAFQFVFICRIVVKDTVNFMSLFGNSSILHVTPVYKYTVRNCCLNIIIGVLNFLTMDFLSSMNDQCIYSNSAHLSRPVVKNTDNKSYRIVPARVLTSPVGYERLYEANPDSPEPENRYHSFSPRIGSENEVENGLGKPRDKIDHHVIQTHDTENNDNRISPVEACEVFSVFISEVEELTSVFTPFTVIIAFLGVANLVTHVCLFVHNDSQHLSYWTFFRTLLFLLVAVRMLICVQQVSSVLGKLPTHVKFRKTSGGLPYMDAKYPSWDDFLELVNGFNLGKRSFGFPLTLRQVASIATFLNMAFLIVLSVFKTYGKRGGIDILDKD